MTAPHFQFRPCPICGLPGGDFHAASNRPAEGMTLDMLRPFWAGLDKEKVFFTYLRCAGCDLAYNPTYFSEPALAGLYADLAPNMDMVPTDLVAATQAGYFDAIAADSELAGDYLEIGPDVGHMVREAARRGTFAHYWLYEPNFAVHDVLARAADGRPVSLAGDMNDLSAVPDGSVGLAVMVHVLDHLIEPLAMVRQIRRKLRPGGMLAIVTHNEASMLRRVLGTRWPPFCLQHPQLYTPTTMERLLTRAGFAGIAISGSSNHFPTDFLARQAAQAVGLNLAKVPLPAIPLRLRLGNMLTLARAPQRAQAAADKPLRELQSA